MAENSKKIMELLQNRSSLFANMSTKWENMDGRAKKYCCTTALYLLSILAQAYNIIIDRSFG